MKAKLLTTGGNTEKYGESENFDELSDVGLELVMCVHAQLCLTICGPVDCTAPGSCVHRIFQAKVQEWAAIFFSMELVVHMDNYIYIYVCVCVYIYIIYINNIYYILYYIYNIYIHYIYINYMLCLCVYIYMCVCVCITCVYIHIFHSSEY